MKLSLKWFIKPTALILIASTITTGCMGRNALTQKVRKANLRVTENRWGREATFLGLSIIWVYRICTVCDLLIFNSIEFWTGENVINGKTPLVEMPMHEVKEKFGFNDVKKAEYERLSATEAKLYLDFEDGDKLTFDVIRDGDSYTVSYLGKEFYKSAITQ